MSYFGRSLPSDANDYLSQVLTGFEQKVEETTTLAVKVPNSVWSSIKKNQEVVWAAESAFNAKIRCRNLINGIQQFIDTAYFEAADMGRVRKSVDDLQESMIIKEHLETELEAVVARVLATELLTAQNKEK